MFECVFCTEYCTQRCAQQAVCSPTSLVITVPRAVARDCCSFAAVSGGRSAPFGQCRQVQGPSAEVCHADVRPVACQGTPSWVASCLCVLCRAPAVGR